MSVSASRRPGRHGHAAALTAAVAMAALLVVAPHAGAQQETPEAAELGLAVEVGFAGRVPSGAWLPVAVTLDPARPVTGTLVVESRSESGLVRVQRRVDVAARTPSVYRFLVPSGPVAVSVEEGGRDSVTVRPRVEPDARTFLVGALGDVPAGPPPLRHGPTGLAGAWVGIDPAWLDQAPESLEPLDALVVAASALDDLPQRARLGLAAGVVAGTDLVVVADRPGPVEVAPGLPVPADAGDPAALDGLVPHEEAATMSAAWIADGDPDVVVAASSLAGHGRIVAVVAAPGQGAIGSSAALWERVVEPRGVVGRVGRPADRTPHQFARVFGAEGGATPALPWLTAFVLAYVVVVGPVNALLLARFGRRELAWATVPAVTVVFTAAAFLAVAGGRPPVGDAARVHATLDGQSTEIVAARVRAPTEGSRSIRLDGDGWVARPLVDGGRPATLEHGGALHTVLDLRALQPGGLVARRPLAATAPLALTAEQDADGVVTVEVANAGDVPVADVRVRAAGTTARIGELAPGASERAEVGRAGLPVADPWAGVFDGVPPSPPGSLLALLRSGLVDGSPGTVWATGSLPAGGTQPDVLIEGAPARDRGTLVVTGVTLRPAGGVPPGPFAVQRRAVAPEARERPSPHALETHTDAYLRFRLPTAALDRGVVADLDRGRQRPAFDVWLPALEEWRALDAAFPDGRAEPAAVLDPLGTVWVRATGDHFPFDFSARTVHGIDEPGGGS